LELAQFFFGFLFEFAQSFVVGACTKICCFYLDLHKAFVVGACTKVIHQFFMLAYSLNVAFYDILE
jgi:hypothetical protein